MEVQEIAEKNIVIIVLSPEPRLSDETKQLLQVATERKRTILLNFSQIDIMYSISLSGLLKTMKILRELGCRLILFNVASSVESIFEATGLDGIFTVADDLLQAVAIAEGTLERSQ